jgi:uncharacterized ferredoxin-like protein
MKFAKYLQSIEEITTSGDIAPVEKKLDLVRRHEKHVNKGKKCKIHKTLNCEICEELEESKWD